jgi:hypothetical protein
MNTSSPQQTITTVLPTVEPTLTVTCPDWCTDTRSNHLRDLNVTHYDDPKWTGPSITCEHTGPRFGYFAVSGQQNVLNGAIYCSWYTVERIDLASSDRASLRQIAADALAAAQWLESHR